MGRTAKSFGRPNPRFKPQPTVLVICEDKKSSLQYLQSVARHFRVHVKVEVTHCGNTDPLGIIQEAVRRQREFDEVYCAIDRDNHENFNDALALAHTCGKVIIIASYPCFEFWLILHYGHNRRPYTSVGNNSAGDRLINELRTHPGMEQYAKGAATSVFESLLGPRFDTARRVSPQVLNEANITEQMNPSTTLHLLIDKFEELSQPKPK